MIISLLYFVILISTIIYHEKIWETILKLNLFLIQFILTVFMDIYASSNFKCWALFPEILKSVSLYPKILGRKRVKRLCMYVTGFFDSSGFSGKPMIF